MSEIWGSLQLNVNGNTASNNTFNGIGTGYGSMSNSVTWRAHDLPYIVSASNGLFTINSGATLTIEQGTIVKFIDTAGIRVEGTLLANGIPSEKIYFTSFKDDSVGGDTNGDGSATLPAKGDWIRFIFDTTSTNSILNSCVIKYAGGSSPSCAMYIYNGYLEVTNCIIRDILGYGISCVNECTPLISYNDIFDTTSYGLYVQNHYNVVDARYNWWGTTTDLLNEVSGLYGQVTFAPYALTKYWSENDSLAKVFGSSSPCGYAGEPINTSTGNFTYEAEDISIAALGFDLQFIRNYNSQDAEREGAIGYGWTYNYNTMLLFRDDDAITVVNPDGKQDYYTYLGNNQYISPPGVIDKLCKNADGTYSLIYDNQNKLSFNSTGRLINQQDRYGNIITLMYTNGYLTSVSAAGGRGLTFTYTNNKLTKIQDNALREVSYGYNAAGELTTFTDLNAKTTTYTYDTEHQLLTIRYPKTSANPALSNTYNNHKVENQYDAFSNQMTFNYDTTNNKTTIKDNRGNNSVHYFDSNFWSTKQTDELGFNTLFSYNALGLVDTATDGNGHQTSYVYDDNGNATEVRDPAGHTTKALFDLSNNNMLWSEDQAGTRTTYTYDSTGKFLTSVADPVITTSFGYYDNGLLHHEITPDSTTTYEYNDAGNLTKLIDPLGNELIYGYDSAGRKTSVTQPKYNPEAAELTTRFTYDSFGNVLSEKDPLSLILLSERHQIDYTYDTNGNTETFIDANNNLTRYMYDDMDKLIAVVDALESTTTYSYDPNYNLHTVTDARSNTTTYEYWANNRLRSIMNSLQNTIQFIYDGIGNTTVVIYPNTNETYFTYNEDDLIDRISYKNEPTSYAFTYNPIHTLQSVVDNENRSFMYGYNLVGWLTDSTDTVNPAIAGGFLTHRSYDSKGRSTSFNINGMDSITYVHNARDDLTDLTLPNQANPITYTYWPNGQEKTMTTPSATHSYSYDVAGRYSSLIIDGISYDKEFTYGYDANGNITNENDTTYSYDALNHLTGWKNPTAESTTTYSYDAVGNLTSVAEEGTQTLASFIYNEANQITNYGFGYDASGNMISDGKYVYVYDGEDRLKSVTRLSDGETIATYVYDYLNRRIKAVEGTKTTYFHYEGSSPNVVAESDANGVITACYYYGNAGELLAMQRGGATYYYEYNVHGDVVSLTNSQGQTVNAYSYDPWGNITQETETVENPYRYAGYRWDSNTKLYYLWNRYYKPDVFRFLTSDFDPGDIDTPISQNAYIYCEDNPINRLDPDGAAYLDLNVTGGYYGGVITIGGQVDDQGNLYIYGGGGLGTPGVSGSLTWSPNNPTRGWNKSVQADGFAAMQAGYSKNITKDSFIELGVGGPFGFAGTIYDIGKVGHVNLPCNKKNIPKKQIKKKKKKPRKKKIKTTPRIDNITSGGLMWC